MPLQFVHFWQDIFLITVVINVKLEPNNNVVFSSCGAAISAVGAGSH